MRRITLTLADGSERKLELNPAAVSAVVGEESVIVGIAAEVHINGTLFTVKESREQILALLDAPAEVTAGFMDEICDHLSNKCLWSMSPKTKADLRAAIEAADRARGLRP
jgi:hypothetical protein